MKLSKIFVGIISLVLAVVLWGYVAFYINPEGEKTVNGIPVEFINEQSLTKRGLMLVSDRNITVNNVRFTGRMQDYANVNKDTVKAVVDLSKVNNAGIFPLEYVLQSSETLDSLNEYKERSIITVEVDKIASKYVDFKLDILSPIAEGYLADAVVFNPARIEVTGPSKVIDTVDKALIQYDSGGEISRTVDIPTDFALVTSSGAAVDVEYITTEYDEVWLTVPILMTKTVQLKVDFVENGGGITKNDIKCDIVPAEVRISGDASVLDGLNSISIATIELANLEGNLTENYTIVYPNDVRNIDSITSAQAVIRIVGDVATRHISTANINLKGLSLPEGYVENLVSKQVTVTLRGPQADLDQVQSHNIRIVADFTDEVLTPGLKKRVVSVFVDGFDTVGVIDKGYEVTIEIVPDTGGDEP